MIIWQSKKILSITLAVLLGITIIFFAWKSGVRDKAPTATTDNSWQETLSVIPETKSLGALNSGTSTNTVATTATAILAQNLLNDYAILRGVTSTTTMSDEDAQAFAENLLKENTQTGAPIKTYTQKDLIITETSSSSVTTYENKLAQILVTLFKEKNVLNELNFVSQATETRDGAKLTPLNETAAVYQKLISTLLAMSVPRASVELHLYILKSYSTLLAGVIDMQTILRDPITGVQGIAKYNSGIEMITQTGKLFPKNK